MSPLVAAGIAAGAVVGPYALAVAALAAAGRRELARAVAGFLPDCLVLVRRLLGDPRVSRADKLLLAALLPYLALPFDLVPDFVPIVGQLDDAVVVALVLRRVLRRAGAEVTAECWPGPPASLRLVLAVAGEGRYPPAQATARISGSSTLTARQNRPPSLET